MNVHASAYGVYLYVIACHESNTSLILTGRSRESNLLSTQILLGNASLGAIG